MGRASQVLIGQVAEVAICELVERTRRARERLRLTEVDVAVVESSDIGLETRAALRELWERAFGDRFSQDDADHAFGGVHALAHDGEHLVGHASAVPRRIRFGDGPWQVVGYVEAVATDPDHQGRGIGTGVMTALHEQIATRWPAALLTTGRARAFYESLGWECWRGPTYTQTSTGVAADDAHGALMILRLRPSVAPDLSATVMCEDRPGDAW
jgi:aminoglycoside 2'-N-acetyltransferase I